ncbi:MAG: SIR2 family NAD-dependent protein deacylase [Phycisphaerae bacterium]
MSDKAPFDLQLEHAREALASAGRIAVLTGAGISAESGVPTYRGAGGVWQEVSMDEVATPEAFARDPQRVWQWHSEKRAQLAEVQPNPGHRALAVLERQVSNRGGRFLLATQNVDGLHQQAGSWNVLELHGSLLRVRCGGCGRTQPIGFEHTPEPPKCPRCGLPMRPDVVWFGETLDEDIFRTALRAVVSSEVFLTVGTSSLVYPAAGLVEAAADGGSTIIEVNLEPTEATVLADIALHGKAGEILPMLVVSKP